MIGSFRAVARSRLHARSARPFVLRAGHVVGVGLLALLAACSQSEGDRAATGIFRLMGSDRNPNMEMLENTVEYVVVPATRTMVNAPTALVVLERNLGGAIEQRIVLPNDTAVRGDNVMHVRAQTADSAQLAQFDFADIEARFGGLPTPFERVTPSSLSSGTDALGTYVYAHESVGTNTVCVLVLRRLGVGARPLPRGISAIDVVMRNCVNGTLAQALEPMSERALSITGALGGANYTLSPHAAPRG